MLDLREGGYPVERSIEPVSACAICGAAVGAGEGITAPDRTRVLTFCDAACLAAGLLFSDLPLAGFGGRTRPGTQRESPASEWLRQVAVP